MARSNHEYEQEAPNPEYESNHEQDPEQTVRTPPRRPRFSLDNGEDDFTLEYLRFAFREDPELLFERINTALVRLITAEARVTTLEAEALAQCQNTAEVMIQNENLQTELLDALRQNRQGTPLYKG
jgi:hypothetical protein